MRMSKIASSAEYQMNEKFQNCQFLEPNFDFINLKNLKILQFCNFDHLKKFAIWQIHKKIQFGNFQKNFKIVDLKNSKNVQFVKF